MPTRKLRADTPIGTGGDFKRLQLAYEKFIEMLMAMSQQGRQGEPTN